MLPDRPDAAELLELLGFHPPHWRRYYQDLWSRYPTLADDWVHVGFLWLVMSHPKVSRNRVSKYLKSLKAPEKVV
jgi:hypothetical protein